MADIQSNIRVNIDTNGALASLKVLQGQISAFHQEMSRSGALAASEMSKLQNSLMNSLNRSGQFDARLKTIKTTTESFTEALEKNKLSMGQYFRYAGAATKDFGKLFKGEFDTIEKVARERVKDLQTQYIKMGRDASGAMKAISIRPLVLDLEDAGTKAQIAAQKQQLLNQLLKQGSTNMLNWGKNTQWAGRQLMVGFTIPLTMLGQIASKTFMDMEQSVIKFQRVYGDFNTTTQQTKEMTLEVTNLAKAFTKYGVAVSDTVGMAADAAAMGKTGKDLLAQVESASRLSVLGGVDQKQALETTISLTNAFGIAADELSGKINFLNAVENQTTTSIDDLTTAIPKAAPVIKQLGGNVEDLAFFLTAMKEGGINASEGANALKSGIASIINPTKKASDMLSGFGINIKGIVDANKGDVKGMVMGVAEALNQLDPLNRAKAIEQLFGKFQFARISTLFKNITDVNSQASKVAELAAQGPEASAILAQRELKKIEESPMFKFKKALEDLKVELIPLGEQFLKMVTPIAEFFKNLLTSFNSLSGGTKDVIGNITMWLAGFGPVLLMTIGLIANGVANMIKMFAMFKSFINGMGKGTQDLGSQTNYMTQQQIEAASVAASLDQVHAKLKQTFTAEAGAVALLRSEMERAVAAQRAFGWTPGATGGKRGRTPRKMATGGVVRGPGGPTDDAVPTNLSNGEVVLSVDTVNKNPGIVAALLQGQKVIIPGFAKSGVAGKKDRIGSGSSGKKGKSNFTVLRPYGANVSNQQGLESFGDLGGMADVTSMYMPQIAKSAGVTITSINQEVDAWKAANKKLLDAAAQAVADGVPAAEAFAEVSQKFKADMTAAEGPVHKFTQAAQTMYPQLEADLREAQAYAAKHNLDVKNASDVDKLRSALPDNIAARGLGTPGNFQAGMKARSAGVAMVTDAADVDKYGVPKTYVDPKLDTKHPLYNKSSSQEHVGRTWAEVENRQSDREQRAEARGKVPAGKGPSMPKAESTQAGKTIADKVESDVADATNAAAQAKSPSRKTKQAGKNLADGAIAGITEAGPAFKKASEKAFIISPASAQHAQDQLRKILKPFTDSSGLVNIKKLNEAYRVQVHVITENEKALRRGAEMLRVARMPQDMLWQAYDNTARVATAAANNVKAFAVQVGTDLKIGLQMAGNSIKTVATNVVTSVRSMAAQVPVLMNKMVGKVKGLLSSAGGRIGAVTGALGLATMIPGQVGEAAGNLMGPMFALQMLLESKMNPTTIMVIAAFAAIAYGIFNLIDSFNKAQDKAIQLGKSMGIGSEAMKKYTSLTNKVTASEIMDERRKKQGSLFQTSSKEPTTGDQYVQSDQGKATIKDIADTIASDGAAAASAKFSSQLVNAVIAGALTPVQARSIADSIGQELGDQQLAMNATADINNLFGPNGENLTDGSFKIYADVVANNNAQLFGANSVQEANALGMPGSEGSVMNRLGGNLVAGQMLMGATRVGEGAMARSAQAGLTAMESGGTMSLGQKAATFGVNKLGSLAETKIGGKLGQLAIGKTLLGIAEKTAAKYAATSAIAAALGPETAGIGTAVVEVGTTVWSLVDAYNDIAKLNENIAKTTAEFAANSVAALDANKQSLDAMDLSYEKRKQELETQLEIAKSQGDTKKVDEITEKLGTLGEDYNKSRNAVLQGNADTITGISDAYKSADTGAFGIGNVRQGLDTAIEKTITDKYAGTGQEAIAAKVLEDTKSMTGTDEQRYVFKNLVGSGQLDLNQAQQYQQMFGGGEGQLSMGQGEDMIKKFGGAQVGQIMSASQGLSAENQQQFVLNMSKMDPQDVTKELEFMSTIQSMGGTMNVQAILDMQVTNPEEFNKLKEGLDNIQNISQKNITIEIATKVLKKGLNKADQGLVDGVLKGNKYFKNLSRKQKLDYLTVVRTQITAAKTPEGIKAIVAWGISNGKIPASLPYSVQAGIAGGLTSQYIADIAKGTIKSNDAAGKYDGGNSDNNNNNANKVTASDRANAALSIMGRKEDKINKAYEERLKALDKIQQANDKINQQKKDQLDLADALSRGDIGAAARAQQQARENAQATALQDQRDQMNAARDAQIASLRVNGMSRDQIQAFLDSEANKADLKTLGKWKGAKGYAMGGLVPKTQYLAIGGKPKGTDTISAMLTPGEFVVKKSAVDKLGAANMGRVNRGEMPTGHGGSVYNYSISVNVKSDADANEIAKTVIAKIEQIGNQAVKGNKA